MRQKAEKIIAGMTQIIETVDQNRRTVIDSEPLADELEAFDKICDDYFSKRTEAKSLGLHGRIDATRTEYSARRNAILKKVQVSF